MVSAGVGDVRTFEDELAALAGRCELIQLVGDQTWFDDLDDPRWEDLNLRREAFFERVPIKLLFWLTPARVAQLARAAPDLWAWRGGVYHFARRPAVNAHERRPPARYERADPDSVPAIGRRITELHGALATDLPNQLRLSLLDEMAALEQRLGRLDQALRIYRVEQLPVFERFGDIRSAAITRGKIADVLQARGELDEALRIHREDELPVFERLGDRDAAITLLREAHAEAGDLGVTEVSMISSMLDDLAAGRR